MRTRRTGQTIAAIATKYLLRKGSSAPARGGRFAHQPPPTGDLVGGKGIASIAGVSEATGLRWIRTGRVPDPDFVVVKSRPLWLTTTVAPWLDEADLETYPSCGAGRVSLNQHRSAAHRAHEGSPR